MRTVVKTSAGLQSRLDAMVRSGSPVSAEKAIGGIQPLGAGEMKFTASVKVGSGQTIIGQGCESRITWLGGPDDPPLFNLSTFAGNGYVSRVTISDMQIDCPNCGRVIGIDRVGGNERFPVTTVKRFVMRNVVIRGGSVDLDGENYGCVLDDVEFVDPKARALRLYGQTHAINSLLVFGRQQTTQPIVEIHGSASFTGFCWLEGWFTSPLLSLHDWKAADGYSHRGNFDASNLWLEAHENVTTVKIDTADFELPSYGGTADWPIELSGAASLTLHRPPNAGAVKKMDVASKLFVNGVEQALAVEK